MGWGFAGERGLWKYICKYKRKMQKTFWKIKGKAETYRGNKRKWKWGRRVLSVCEIWVLLCKSASWERKKYFCLASLSQGLWITKRDAPQYQYQYQLRTPTLKKWSKRLEIDRDEGKSREKHVRDKQTRTHNKKTKTPTKRIFCVYIHLMNRCLPKVSILKIAMIIDQVPIIFYFLYTD